MLRDYFTSAPRPVMFAQINEQKNPRKSIEDLQRMGFKTMARSTTPWTTIEEEKLKQALIQLHADATVIQDYKTVQKWISWSVLGGSRSPLDVQRKMNARLRELHDIQSGLSIL